jgi:hypothetical protein
MKVRCPACKSVHSIDNADAGKAIACSCGKQFKAPASPSHPAKPAATVAQPTTVHPKPAKPVVVKPTVAKPAAAKPPAVKPAKVLSPASPKSSHVSCDCGKTLRIPESAFGKKVRCPCGKLVDIAADGSRSLTTTTPQSHNFLNESLLAELPSVSPTAYSPTASGSTSSPWQANATESTTNSNPYAAPSENKYSGYTSPYQSQLGDANAESIRRAHIQHEASIRSVGTFQQIGAVMNAIYALMFIYLIFVPPQEWNEQRETSPAVHALVMTFTIVFLAGASALFWWIGAGLKNFRTPQRTVATIFFAIGLMALPLGTLINGYFLWLLHSQKGNTIFTSEYRRIVRATPHVRPGMSCMLKALIIFLILAILLTIFIIVLMMIQANSL